MSEVMKACTWPDDGNDFSQVNIRDHNIYLLSEFFHDKVATARMMCVEHCLLPSVMEFLEPNSNGKVERPDLGKCHQFVKNKADDLYDLINPSELDLAKKEIEKLDPGLLSKPLPPHMRTGFFRSGGQDQDGYFVRSNDETRSIKVFTYDDENPVVNNTNELTLLREVNSTQHMTLQQVTEPLREYLCKGGDPSSKFLKVLATVSGETSDINYMQVNNKKREKQKRKMESKKNQTILNEETSKDEELSSIKSKNETSNEYTEENKRTSLSKKDDKKSVMGSKKKQNQKSLQQATELLRQYLYEGDDSLSKLWKVLATLSVESSDPKCRKLNKALRTDNKKIKKKMERRQNKTLLNDELSEDLKVQGNATTDLQKILPIKMD